MAEATGATEADLDNIINQFASMNGGRSDNFHAVLNLVVRR